jgi:hypothetical protein
MNWAQINNDNKVVNVIVAEENKISEVAQDGFTYVATDMNNVAHIGGFYFSDTNTFSLAQPFDSWTFSQEQRKWNPPVPKPSEEILTKNWLDGTPYEVERWIWDEENGEWIEQ